MPVERTVPGVCHSFNLPNSKCTRDNCQELHVCFYFATGKCPFGDKCTRTHLLTTVDNKAVLRANGWHYDNQHPKILKLLRKKEQDVEKDKQISRVTPSACIAYNNGVCDIASCPFLHVCFDYIMGSCDQKGKCLKEHNIWVGQQNIAVLRRYNLLLCVKSIFAKIREGYEAAAIAATAADIEASDGATGGTTPPPSAAQSRATLLARLTCSVCCEPFIRATTLGCTHTFCEDCVRRTERQGQPCPLCRAPIATAVGSLIINETVAEWFDGQDEETQRARRQLETERRRAAAVPQPR